MSDNKNLTQAKGAKKDEFYTRLEDIENELKHYRKHFRDKAVLCNCDDPYESNFFTYFALNFNALGLKRLTCTCYVDSPIEGTQMSFFDIDDPEGSDNDNGPKQHPYKIVINEVPDANGDGAVDMADVEWLLRHGDNVLTELEGDGDFRSDECVELLDQADIVVTNPPFSLFREYVAQLMEHEKKFLIIGNQNAITYKEIFPLLKDNKMWLGYKSGHTLFAVPKDYTIPDYYDKSDQQKLRSNGYVIDDNGRLWRNLGNICWYTNLDISKRHDKLDLFKTYAPDEYYTYDNLDGINVDKVSDIPCDYPGLIGVPITFMDKYSPDQFEILGLSRDMDLPTKRGMSEKFIHDYFEQGGTAQITIGHPDLTYFEKDGKAVVPYRRVIIRNKHPEQPME